MSTDKERLDFYEKHRNDLSIRYGGSPTMDGVYPCWMFWSPIKGSTNAKTLREAIDVSIVDKKKYLESKVSDEE